MARCSSTRCERLEEELLANQMEQRRLLANHVVTHAAKLAAANTNLLKGVLETGVLEGIMVPEEISMEVIRTFKVEVEARKRAIAQSKSSLQQRERLFSHPLNDNRSMMSEKELQEWRDAHRRLTVVEERRVKELEREIVRVALGRDPVGASGDEAPEDREVAAAGTSEALAGTPPSNKDEEVSTDTEMESFVDAPEEVGEEVLEDTVDEVNSVLVPNPTQLLQSKNNVESPALLCKDCPMTFSNLKLVMAHAMTKHWVRGSRRQHCPLNGCNYVVVNGGYGIGKLSKHM